MSSSAENITENDIITKSNSTPPQNCVQQSHNRVTSHRITAAATLQRLDDNLLLSVASYFNTGLSRYAAKSTESESLITGILTAVATIGESHCLDAELSRDTLCCFNSAGQMICSLLSFDSSSHPVVIPGFLKSAATNMSQLDRVKLLSQEIFFTDPEKHETAELTWEDLTIPQMQSVLSYYEISHNKEDGRRDMKRKLSQHGPFSRTHGKDNKIALFSFTSSDPLDCIAISSVPKEEAATTKLTLDFVTKEAVQHGTHQNLKLTTSSPKPNQSVMEGSAFNKGSFSASTISSPENFSPSPENQRERMESDDISLSTSSPSPFQLESDPINDSDGNHDINYCKDSSKTPIISVDLFDFSIAPRKDLGIVGDFCTKCQADASNHILTCYLCNLSVHYPCYKGKFKDKRKEMPRTTFDTVSKLNNYKWFCNGCSKISIVDILEKVSQYTKVKVKEVVEDKCAEFGHQTHNKTSSTLEDTLESKSSILDYDNSKPSTSEPNCTENEIQTIDQLKDSITQELRVALREDIQSLVTAITQSSLTQAHPRQHGDGPSSHGTIPATSYATKAAAPPSHNCSTEKFIAAQKNINPHRNTNNRPENLVDPKMSVIIKQVSCKNVVADDTSLKSEFNKLFNRMKIKYCKKTRYGNIILQLTSEEDIQQVLNNWKSEYFKDSKATVGTQVFRMTDQHLMQHVGIVRHVPANISTASISQSLNAANMKNIRAIRLGKASNSVKVIFNSQEDLARAIDDGFGVDHLWLDVAPFRFNKKPMQCHGCKRFGHPVKWCRSQRVCGFCSSEDHLDKDCVVKANPSKHLCRNCKGNHSALSTQCPHYLLKLGLLSNSSQHGF